MYSGVPRTSRTGNLPPDATDASRIRLELAFRLAESCPIELGPEIALTGSASRGVADLFSDIELNLWVHHMPSEHERVAWLEQMGAAQITPENVDSFDGTHWTTCRLGEIWVELGWDEKARHEDLLRSILSGDRDSYRALALGWTVQRAIPLRTVGWINRWQRELQSYPNELQRKIIRDNTEAWSDPHVPVQRWILASRGQLFALSMRLQWDVMNLLRILWAINRQWDQDWKWIDEQARGMSLKPDRLAQRVNLIFVLADPEQSVRTCFELIVETLALVPSEIDVAAALASVRAALNRGPLTPPP